jgi:hypothetical protein
MGDDSMTRTEAIELVYRYRCALKTQDQPALAEAGAVLVEALTTDSVSDNDPMPVFPLQAEDRLAATAIEAYRVACRDAGLNDQAFEVGAALAEFLRWEARHPERMKLPDHKHVPVPPVVVGDTAEIRAFCARCRTAHAPGQHVMSAHRPVPEYGLHTDEEDA